MANGIILRERRRAMRIETGPGDPTVEEELRRLQYTPEERARLFHGAAPFRLADWQQEAPPATAAELAEMEELLRQRDAEREASLMREAGLNQ
jgi:hypothetical protein